MLQLSARAQFAQAGAPLEILLGQVSEAAKMAIRPASFENDPAAGHYG
jgi:hypothetical protein